MLSLKTLRNFFFFVKVYFSLASSCLQWRFSLQTSDKDQTPLPNDKPEDDYKTTPVNKSYISRHQLNLCKDFIGLFLKIRIPTCRDDLVRVAVRKDEVSTSSTLWRSTRVRGT